MDRKTFVKLLWKFDVVGFNILYLLGVGFFVFGAGGVVTNQPTIIACSAIYFAVYGAGAIVLKTARILLQDRYPDGRNDVAELIA